MKKKFVKIVVLLVIVLTVTDLIAGIMRVKNAKAQYCAECVTGCILPNRTPGASNYSGTEVAYTDPYPYTMCSCAYRMSCETFC